MRRCRTSRSSAWAASRADWTHCSSCWPARRRSRWAPRRSASSCVTAFAGEVAVVKPQSAFFERFGAAGIAVLERTIRSARQAGALVLLDVKRGDIGSTMAAYAEAYLGPSAPLAADAITV